MAKKKSSYFLIIILVILLATLLPVVINLFNSDNQVPETVPESSEVVIVQDYQIQFEDNASTINLLSGYIKTKEVVTNVFINVNRIGCQDLKYKVIKDEKDCYTVLFEPNYNICQCSFATNFSTVADIYIEYSGRSYLVCSQKLDLVSAWGLPV